MKFIYVFIIVALQPFSCFSKANSPELQRSPASSLIEDLNDIVTALEKNSPQLMENFTEEDKKIVIKAFIDSLDAGVKLSEDKTLEKNVESTKTYTPFYLSQNNFLYLRIDSLSIDSVLIIKDELQKYSNDTGDKKGCILDLRSCEGYDILDAMDLLETLRNVRSKGKIRVSILVGHKTSGSSEILARIIETERLGLIVGGDTAGHPVPQKNLSLKSGETLELPTLNEHISIFDIRPVHPKLCVDENSQISYNDLLSSANKSKSDKCLSKAIDVMISINVIQ